MNICFCCPVSIPTSSGNHSLIFLWKTTFATLHLHSSSEVDSDAHARGNSTLDHQSSNDWFKHIMFPNMAHRKFPINRSSHCIIMIITNIITVISFRWKQKLGWMKHAEFIPVAGEAGPTVPSSLCCRRSRLRKPLTSPPLQAQLSTGSKTSKRARAHAHTRRGSEGQFLILQML